MRRLFAFVIALAGCGGSVADPPANADASTLDTNVADVAAPDTSTPPGFDVSAGDVTVEFEGPNFAFCHCHHGVGPGIDGAATIRITNAGTRAAKIEVQSLRLLATALDTPQYETSPSGYAKLKTAGGMFDSITVPGGTTSTATLVVYIDSRDEAPPAVNYRIELRYLDEGVARIAVSKGFIIKIE